MLNNEFEKQVKSAMLLIAQEQIPNTPHRFPSDFEERLMQQTEESDNKQIHTKITKYESVQPCGTKDTERMPRILKWGGLAASVMVALTVGALVLHIQRNEMQQLSSVPVETIENKTVDSNVAEISTSTQASESRQTKTTVSTVEHPVTMSLSTESTTVSEQSFSIVNETRTLPLAETAPQQKAETTTVVTAVVQEQNEQSHEQAIEAMSIGDFDLDGTFTPADCAWAFLIRTASSNAISVIEILPITNEQREQCALISFEELSRIDTSGDAQQRIESDTEYYSNADAFDRDFPLSSIEYNAVMETGGLVYTYGLFPDLDIRGYLANQSYYNNILIEQLSALNQNPPAFNMQEQEKWINLRTMIGHYIHDLQIEKNNETHETVFRSGDDQPFGDVTWEQLLAELEDAKTWKGPIRFTISRFQDREIHEST